ncbi:MAG TPA: phage holin family protein [Steroidobacteraceae bacterium]|nr:phage holin family protein [Steroidobacteraceae bacterium]
MVGFILRALAAALGLWLATEYVDGISIDTPTTLIIAGVLLGLVNAIVRPIAVVLTFPFLIITLGLFLLVVNAAMLGLVAAFLDGFRIAGFWPAFWAALIVSITSWIASWFIGSKGRIEAAGR